MRSSCSELYRQEVSESEAELGPEYVLDKGAAEEMENKNQRLCNSLENELHATKASMIKEHIRLAFQRMGDFQYERGDMEAAHKAYARMKDYCTTAEHATDMCLKAALVLIDMGSFEAASIYLARGDPSGTADTQSKARLGAVSGLLLLREGRFKGMLSCAHAVPRTESATDELLPLPRGPPDAIDDIFTPRRLVDPLQPI